MHQFYKFILSWNSTCFWRFVYPSSGVYSLYTQQWYMSYRFVDSFRAEAYAPARKLSTNLYDIPVPSVQWINSWWWTDELSETCRFSWQNKFVKLVHLVGFITKKFIMMHGHMNVKFPHVLSAASVDNMPFWTVKYLSQYLEIIHFICLL